MERVLPTAEVKERIAGLAVGLAADCDAPENDVSKLMQANLAGASTLPFVGFVTWDGKWVGGFSGPKDTAAFLKVLEEAEKSPYLLATAAVQKQLAGLADRAGKAAEKGDWKTVMKACGDAAKTTGRCPERDALRGLEKKAREWAAEQLGSVVTAAGAGGDLAEARKSLETVRKHFAGEAEAADADLGMKALKRLAQITSAEEGGKAAPAIREKAAKDYEGTRWALLFQEAAEEPADENEDE